MAPMARFTKSLASSATPGSITKESAFTGLRSAVSMMAKNGWPQFWRSFQSTP
jgi:hypothetical protein